MQVNEPPRNSFVTRQGKTEKVDVPIWCSLTRKAAQSETTVPRRWYPPREQPDHQTLVREFVECSIFLLRGLATQGSQHAKSSKLKL